LTSARITSIRRSPRARQVFVHQIPDGAIVIQIDTGSSSTFSVGGQPKRLRTLPPRAGSKALTKGLIDELGQGDALLCGPHLCRFEQIVV